MNKTMDFSQLGGLYVYQSTLDYLQQAYSTALDAIAAFFGSAVIVQGLTPSGGNISDGWVVYNGELIPVTGGAQLTYLHLETTVTKEQFDDGTQKDVYTSKRYVFSSTSAGNIHFSSFVRLPYNSNTIKDALTNVKTILKNIINTESAVILSGCVATLAAPNVSITAGTALMDGELVTAPAYNGAYPAYLKPDGTYVTAQPAGTFIKFDHDTSQHYADVQRRLTYTTGMVMMSTAAADLAFFDVATGLGKWKWLGWKICDLLESRVPVGYDRRTVDPNDNVYDINNHTLGATYGEKKHTLTTNEMPAHSHKEFSNTDGTNNGDLDANGTPAYTSGWNGDFKYQIKDGDTTANVGNTSTVGGGQSHENRQPSKVILFIEKI